VDALSGVIGQAGEHTPSRSTWALRLSLSIRTVLNNTPYSLRRPSLDAYLEAYGVTVGTSPRNGRPQVHSSNLEAGRPMKLERLVCRKPSLPRMRGKIRLDLIWGYNADDQCERGDYQRCHGDTRLPSRCCRCVVGRIGGGSSDFVGILGDSEMLSRQFVLKRLLGR
jgi:hypothetical protein